MDGRIPLIFCIDVEPDEQVFNPEDPSPWAGFEALAVGSARLRDRLSKLTGEPARFAWFLRLDPQIAEAYGDPAWIIDKHRAFFDAAMAMGDAVGVHPHAWRWERARRVWVADHKDPGWVERCMEMSFAAYESRFEVAPQHHRFGGRFVSERVLSTAARLGTRFDLTLEPGEPGVPPGEYLGNVWKGEIPDYRRIPRTPYHPDRSDFRRPSDDGRGRLWTIPLSSGSVPRGPRQLRVADRLSHPVRTARGVVRRVGSRLRRPATGGDPGPSYRLLRMWDWPSPIGLWESAFASLEKLEHHYLAFAIRSDMEPMVDGVMSALEEHPQARRLVFTTPEDALARLGLTPGADK